MQYSVIATRIIVSMGPIPFVRFFAFKTAPFGTELQVSIGSQTSPVVLCMRNSVPSIRFTSLYGSPALICGFCMQNSDFWTRITNLYGFQTSPVVLCMQYSVISTRITCLYGSQPLSVVFSSKTATFGAELQLCMGSRPDLWF